MSADDPGLRSAGAPAAQSSPELQPGPDDALWSVLLAGAEPERQIAAFLELQRRLVHGARRALVLLGPPDRGPFSVAATSPEGKPPVSLVDAAERAISGRTGVLIPRREGSPSSPATLEGSLVAQPLLFGGRLHGALVLEVTPRPEPELRALLRLLRWGTGWIDALVARQDNTQERSGRTRIETVLGLLAASLEHTSIQGTATAFATELATEVGCDRVAVGFLRRGRVQVRALSHSAHVARKTNLVRAIEAAMEEAIDQEGTVVFPSGDAESPPGTHAHAELARQYGSGAIVTLPLIDDSQPCGAVTLERSEERPFDAETLRLCEAAVGLAGPILEARRREDRWIVSKLLESVRTQLHHLVGPQHVALKLATAAAVLFVGFLVVAKGDYRVTADTTLEPRVMRAASAPYQGYVRTAPARPGDLVSEGQVLATLDDRDLRLEQTKWESQRGQVQKQYRQALAERDAPRAEILAASLDEARAELARIEDRLARAELRAPFDGVVVNGDLSQKLGAPVERGEVLFEVAPLDAYRVILKVDESDVTDIEVGQSGSLIFGSLPSERHTLRVEKLTPVATAEEGINYFRVEAKLDAASSRLRPGLEGVAKVGVDRRRLVWIWTHEVWEWVRLALWRWLP